MPVGVNQELDAVVEPKLVAVVLAYRRLEL
jgi:hypothetical protein